MDWTKASIIEASVAGSLESGRLIFARWGEEGEWVHIGTKTVVKEGQLLEPEVVMF